MKRSRDIFDERSKLMENSNLTEPGIVSNVCCDTILIHFCNCSDVSVLKRLHIARISSSIFCPLHLAGIRLSVPLDKWLAIHEFSFKVNNFIA